MKEKLVKEIKSVLWVTLYFLIWFGFFMLIKILLLREYSIDVYGMSSVIIGAMIAAKAVIILENVPLFNSKTQPAIVNILLRTLLYMTGIFVIMVLEKSIEEREKYDGVFNATKHLFENANSYHLWVNSICVFGALLFYNIGSVLHKHLGEGGIWKVLSAPLPKNK